MCQGQAPRPSADSISAGGGIKDLMAICPHPLCARYRQGNLQLQLTQTWGVIVCDRCVGSEHLCPIIALELECDVLPDRQPQDMRLARKTKSGTSASSWGHIAWRVAWGHAPELSAARQCASPHGTAHCNWQSRQHGQLASETTKGLIKQLHATGVAGWRLDRGHRRHLNRRVLWLSSFLSIRASSLKTDGSKKTGSFLPPLNQPYA